jgi:uncharacterized membrane protein
MNKELYHVPQMLECDGVQLFEGEESVSVADKEKDANYWISLRYITECQKVFSLEVTTFKKSLGLEFFKEFEQLVAKHTK